METFCDPILENRPSTHILKTRETRKYKIMKNFDYHFLLHIYKATLFTVMCVKYEGAVTLLQLDTIRFLLPCCSSRNPKTEW